jgi:peptidoglycan biosynthesis protein MviN/MurJ (putative lipid II flippase)
MFMLSRRLDGLEMRAIASDFIRILLAASVMGAAAWGTCTLLETWLPGATLTLRLLRVSAAIAMGILVLLIAARMLRLEDFDIARRRVLSRFVRR